MIGDEVPGQVAGTDDGVIGFVGDAELAQLPLHGIGRPRRVGDQDDGAALLAIGVQRLAGFGKRLEPVMHHAPDVGEDDIDAVHEVAQPFDEAQCGHEIERRLARSGGAARQRGIAGRPRGGLGGRAGDGNGVAGAIRSIGTAGFLVRSGPAGSRCPLGPQRPRRGKQEALPKPHVIVEQIDHRALALDLFGDQVDAEAAEQIGKVGGMDVGGRALPGIEQQRRRHLDEADAAVGEFPRLDPQDRVT